VAAAGVSINGNGDVTLNPSLSCPPIMTNAPITASAHTHMWTPPPGYHQEWGKHTVHVHGFASLSAERNARFYSPEFRLVGNQWCLRASQQRGVRGPDSHFTRTTGTSRSPADFITSLTDEENGGKLYEELRRHDAKPFVGRGGARLRRRREEPPTFDWMIPPSILRRSHRY
jgi:hypothetical protein